MVKVKLGEDIIQSKIRFKVRFDFKADNKPRKFFFGGKSLEQAAQDAREEQIALLKNIPVQGVYFLDYDISLEPYVIYDDLLGEKVAYAPAEITLNADSIEDIIRFVMREEFRKLEILEPPQMLITSNDLEKILFKMNEELRNRLMILDRKIKR
ncbi:MULTISPECIES: hypothetical protein [Tepidanaerobacter]|uniref:Uncharacterized protein n=1 Tax=Tepidanaerobacter syntrophicus TaxID=224999 RepID=A0A0U9HHG2_9FIRM|nr:MULTISPECIES: hypothetical protein [Tepidanaerobacter]GAQ26157.1 hypothetical protein TSYNT_9416 [Tepidanaerobacter syntrophicus]GLI19145.1 hypothetical protein TSYNTROPHJE_09580 [Tepidanaerobacter syntrophicus]GLI50223.1 hypothetical protein TSYNTROOL_03090 [Tepidanaerobacter syntrophicus]HHV83873.1 hypothetical protein [Tepidanaerobacter syntrophicus]